MPKIELPRFFEDSGHRMQIIGKLKLIDCPHCGHTDCLIRNGPLLGNDPAQQGTARIVRGQRIRCKHCGRSSAIFEPTSAPGRSAGSDFLSALLGAVLDHAGCVHAAWQAGSRRFSLGTAYRLWKKFRLAQTHLRHRLAGLLPPPPVACAEPALQLIAHLRAAFPGADPVATFQARFQRPFLPRC